MFASSSFASIITLGGTAVADQGQVSSVAGVTTVDFNTLPLSTPAGISYTGLGANSITSGSVSGQCAAPPGDTSNYLCVGPNRNTPVTINLSGAFALSNYFGFYVGSVDDFNFIDFYNGDTLTIALTGTQIANRAGIPPTGNQALGYYVNIYASAGEEFNKIVLRSTQNALETDNHAFGVERTVPGSDSGIPEPSTYLTLIPALGYLVYRRKRS